MLTGVSSNITDRRSQQVLEEDNQVKTWCAQVASKASVAVYDSFHGEAAGASLTEGAKLQISEKDKSDGDLVDISNKEDPAGDKEAKNALVVRTAHPILQNTQEMSSSLLSSNARMPSLHDQLDHRLAIPECEFETIVTKEEFQALKTFWEKWAARPFPSNAPSYLQFNEFSKRFPVVSQIQHLQALENAYRSLVNKYDANKAGLLGSHERRMRQEYPHHLSILTDMIQMLCLRDAFVLDSHFPTYCVAYEENIHPSFKIFQRYVNFFQRMLENEEAPEIDNPHRLFTLRESEGIVSSLAFLRESDGWLPFPVNYSTQALFTQAAYLHYGEKVLPAPNNVKSHLIIIEGKHIVDQSGYVIELRKLPAPLRLEVKCCGYCGYDSPMPYINTDKQVIAYNESDEMLVEILSPYFSNVASFLASEEECEICFIPLPLTDYEQDEFTYCFLRSLLSELALAKSDDERER